MIQDQIRSLAKTPNPLEAETLPPLQVFIVHHALSWVERYCRGDSGRPYPPEDPQPYEIPPEIEERLDQSIQVLPLEEFRERVDAFLKDFKHITPTRENLLDHLAAALEPPRYIDRFVNPHAKKHVVHTRRRRRSLS